MKKYRGGLCPVVGVSRLFTMMMSFKIMFIIYIIFAIEQYLMEVKKSSIL